MAKRRRRKSKKHSRVEHSAGGVVWRAADQGPELLLIRDSHEHWALPKGRLEPGESSEAAARRETSEETGLTALALTRQLVTTDFWFEDRWEQKGQRVHKYVDYFLYELVEPQPVITSVEEHVLDHQWVPAMSVRSHLDYPSLKPVIDATLVALGLEEPPEPVHDHSA